MNEVVSLASADDARLAPYRDLVHSRHTRRGELFVVEGAILMQRLAESDLELVSALVSQSFANSRSEELPNGATVFVLDDGEIRRLTGFDFHRGVLACGRRPQAPSLEQLARVEKSTLTLAVCPAPFDAENLGAIMRSAWAFGADGMMVAAAAVDPYCRRALRVSMGAAFHLPIYQSSNLLDDVAKLKDYDVEVVAAVADHAAAPLPAFVRRPRTAIVFGNEGEGLEEKWLKHCGRTITIPMRSQMDSLNVSVAAGVALYHFSMTETDG